MRNGIIKYASGSRYWYQNDHLHRLDGPAIEYANGSRGWYQNGELHREDGPALEYPDGDRYWYINDIKYTEEEYNIEMRLRKWGLLVDNKAPVVLL